MTIFGTAMSRQTKENVCDAQSIPVHLHCLFENCHKSCNSKKHINEHFLSTAMDRHVLNSRPHAVVGYGIIIFGRGLFMTSSDHLAISGVCSVRDNLTRNAKTRRDLKALIRTMKFIVVTLSSINATHVLRHGTMHFSQLNYARVNRAPTFTN